MKTMKVVIPGVLTTVQDLGRFGYQKSGMTCSGVNGYGGLSESKLSGRK